MTEGQQEDQGGWWGAGKERVVGSEVRETMEDQILEDLVGYCKDEFFLRAWAPLRVFE